jgi:hypothetical protein
MRGVFVVFVSGLLLIALNELTTDRLSTKVVTKYVPRDLDAFLKDPENQPMYMYKDVLFGDNVRTI